MAVRTLKDGESKLEYVLSRDKLIKDDKPKKKDVRAIDIVLPQECYCAALKPRAKALILLQEKNIPKNPSKVKLNPTSIVFQRKQVFVDLLKDALKESLSP